MAKKAAAKVNKSNEIRAYKKAHPRARPKDICAGLKAKGIEVSPALVSNMLGARRKKKKAVRRGAKAASRAKKSAARESVNVNELIDAKEFAEKCGGVEKAQAMLKTLSKVLGS